MVEESNDERSLVNQMLGFARRQRLLRQFVQEKYAEGVITKDHVQQIGEAADNVYREHGMLLEPGENPTLVSNSETRLMTVIARHACSFLEAKLVELYPELADEVKSIGSQDRLR
jgi:hypothetical protein